MTCENCYDTGIVNITVNGIKDTEFCQECCEHEFDSSEGFMCIDCGFQGGI